MVVFAQHTRPLQSRRYACQGRLRALEAEAHRLYVSYPPHVEFYQENDQKEQLRGNADKIEQVLRRIDCIIEAQEAWTYNVLKGEAVANALEIDGEAVRNWALNEEHE